MSKLTDRLHTTITYLQGELNKAFSGISKRDRRIRELEAKLKVNEHLEGLAKAGQKEGFVKSN